MRERFTHCMTLRLTEAMSAELNEVSSQTGQFQSEIIRQGISSEIAKKRRELKTRLISKDDWQILRDLATDRGVPIPKLLSEIIRSA